MSSEKRKVQASPGERTVSAVQALVSINDMIGPEADHESVQRWIYRIDEIHETLMGEQLTDAEYEQTSFGPYAEEIEAVLNDEDFRTKGRTDEEASAGILPGPRKTVYLEPEEDPEDLYAKSFVEEHYSEVVQ